MNSAASKVSRLVDKMERWKGNQMVELMVESMVVAWVLSMDTMWVCLTDEKMAEKMADMMVSPKVCL